MREYVSPEFYVMEFEANEYVAACNHQSGDSIELVCAHGGGESLAIQYAHKDTTGNVVGYYVSGTASNGAQSSGNVWLNVQGGEYNPNDYAIFDGGTIAESHDTDKGAGEYYANSAAAQYSLCNCQYYSTTGIWQSANNHHHLGWIFHQNPS